MKNNADVSAAPSTSMMNHAGDHATGLPSQADRVNGDGERPKKNPLKCSASVDDAFDDPEIIPPLVKKIRWREWPNSAEELRNQVMYHYVLTPTKHQKEI